MYLALGKYFKIFAVLLLIICFIITATSCATPPLDNDTEDNGSNTEGEGNTNNNTTPEGENPSDSGNNESENGENNPQEGEDNTGSGENNSEPDENNPGSGDNQSGSDGNNGGENTPEVIIEMDYETYMSLSESEQYAFYLSFDNIQEFFEWFNAAKEKYKEEHPGVDLPDGDINLFG